MELFELNELVQKSAFPLDKLKTLSEKYPSAKKEFVEQVLSYVRNHGMTFSYVMNMMEMDTDFLLFLGLSKAENNAERLIPEVSQA